MESKIMAKVNNNTKKKKTAEERPLPITITYDLFDLPTAQHKAGLAGLLLQIEYMEHRRPKLPAPRIVKQSATSATIEFTEETLLSLMNCLYDAETVEVRVKAKWQNATPLREDYDEEKDDQGKTKRVKVFVYEQCQPKGHFLQKYFTGKKEVWLKLWRDMLWAIPRGNPQSRQPFQQCAAKETCKEGPAAWADLQKVAAARDKNEFFTSSVAGSLWLGAQANNAENVAFDGRAEQNLLLHFWPLTSLVYVPQVVTPDGKSDFVGYVLAIPEVVSLKAFLACYPRMLEGLSDAPHGYRPAEAVIDLPAEGALSFLEHLARLAADKATETAKSDMRNAIGSVDYLHLAKFGNNIKTMAAGRVSPRPYLLRHYQAIVGRPGEKPPYGNPLFRRSLMLALLNDVPWFEPFGELFAEWPHEFFVPCEDSPKLSWFWADARNKFKEVTDDMQNNPQSPPDPNDLLAKLINKIVWTYLNAKTDKKPGASLDEFKVNNKIEWEKVTDAAKDTYSKARREIAESLFLEFRSRHDQAFVNHFVGKLGSVKQYINESDYIAVSQALMTRCSDVKTLTLLALSANS
jgi:CRISPR-associated protein Cmx8